MKYLVIVLTVMSCAAYAQDFSLFEKKTFITTKGDTLPYRILFPENYDKKKKYPLVLFLHGGGERGNDNEKQLTHGVKLFLDPTNRQKYPCIVIAPQCFPDSQWPSAKYDRTQRPLQIEFDYNNPISKALAAVTELTYDVIKKEAVQKTEIYITGLSMGGMGTYEMVWRNPGLFTAAAPVCGGGDAKMYTKKQATPKWWLFHGEVDGVVEVKNSREMYEKLKELKANVKYTEYPGVDHNSWENAYAEPDFMKWMFEKNFKFN